MPTFAEHPIGTPGQPWGSAEFDTWRARQRVQRAYTDVLTAIAALPEGLQRQRCGDIQYPDAHYAVWAVRNRWQAGLPWVLVTGGVHGYETSGVWGALHFLATHALEWDDRANLLVLPCVSPWAYERVHRWNWDGIDPNRSFKTPSPSQESAAVMRLVAQVRQQWQADFVAHVDLHETTLSDETEFRPALAARDGQPFVPGSIPDGFYLVDDSENPQPAFQQAVLQAVAEVTHIAEADAQGWLIGSPVAAPGVIRYPLKALGLCASVTGARYTTTTEVFPDSPRTTPERCNLAQAVAVQAALRWVTRHH
jgi:hypothetical protein